MQSRRAHRSNQGDSHDIEEAISVSRAKVDGLLLVVTGNSTIGTGRLAMQASCSRSVEQLAGGSMYSWHWDQHQRSNLQTPMRVRSG